MKEHLKKILSSEWMIGLLLVIIFLATNGYTIAWDDQHLEIPLLKSLINSRLYAGDYYVESLKHNFTSYLYPLLARVITTEQIPAAFFLLFLISRYFLFFWMYKFWRILAKDKLTAFCCVLMIILLGRVEEFLYRTFSHQEFALAFIMAGMYFFYKDRHLLAAGLLGISCNIHVLYSLFPFAYLIGHLLLEVKKRGIKPLVKSLAVFTLCASPIIIWIALKRLQSYAPAAQDIYKDWLMLYRLACPQNFILYDKSIAEVLASAKTFFESTRGYWILISFYLLNAIFNPAFREDKKSRHAIAIGFAMLIFSLIFSHVLPSRFVLDLNLIRNTQFMLFFLMGHTCILFMKTAREDKWFATLIFAFFFTLIRFGFFIPAFSGLGIMGLLGLKNAWPERREPKGMMSVFFSSVILLSSILGIMKLFWTTKYSPLAMLSLNIINGLLVINYLLHFFFKNARTQQILRRAFVLLPFICLIFNYMYYHYQHVKIQRTGTGFWQLQRHWIDMQKYVKENTPENSLLLVPYDMEMGGFRIFSERKIVMSYRDCGIIGFDYPAALEWHKRLKNIEAFQVFVRGPIEEAIKNAITVYRVNYIVFMRYLNFGASPLWEHIYSNEVFSLYRVWVNPVRD